MTFTSQPGTYGARQPGRMVTWVDTITSRVIRRSGKLGSIDVAGRTVQVHAEQLTGDARDEAWRSITAANARFSQYEASTDRVVPVVRLTERSA